MAEFAAGELVLWDPSLFAGATGGDQMKGLQGMCRFAPNCAPTPEVPDRRPSHPGCPDSPAMYAERFGGPNLTGFERWVPLCRDRAIQRFGIGAVERVDAGE